MGDIIDELRAAGVNVSISTNNIVNPFTPYGHPDLLRQSLVAAMAAHLGNLEQMAWLLDLVTVNPARVLGIDRAGFGHLHCHDLFPQAQNHTSSAHAVEEHLLQLMIQEFQDVWAGVDKRDLHP